mmetsp:Transcript_29052/g.92734  ORF Transcript_29052/g.92734 Transcript_29052/m.92734 type:complete len:323 (-) Transcript_29052:48-1016(-)|eukprot:CAMPEP_0182882904 /NCGR_PEP_ID=MMETSP0034_2-20130328/18066_1 /TAXON_ID=156128 /ORGANISM="Nephroselmis pyriformis, Strain CCMP717" /LENGTH=322 /DNA_ID=CAMNT_0025016023 /DNA_START=131 /DNA_END=1099 /DNA_ORIENTATION=-
MATIKSLKNFEIMRTVGTGTFGTVKIVKNINDGKFFALKTLKKNEVIRLKQINHIMQEKQMLMEVDHPFIVHLYATLVDDKQLHMLMEYVAGGEIFTQLRKVERFNTETARFYTASIVLALGYLHSKDIVYRDLKPENLLIDRKGYIKITDFGFAKRVSGQTWTLCGTPEYLAPEIVQTKGHGKGVDWWALGILIFEMLAGYPPFYDEQPFGIYNKILVGIDSVEFPQHFDSAARDLIRKLLHPSLDKRLGVKGGFEEVMRHRWFAKVDFAALEARQVKPPFVPEVSGDGDTHNFDKYPETPYNESGPIITEERSHALFSNF